jgi:alkanesulfonate monooxygenase SsuD/methylene tetrahydromethanopterin reductase-like flavin-dependent oxidoreductase (luciferase family)
VLKEFTIGVQLSIRLSEPWEWDQIKAFSIAAEELGYDSLWFGDHLFSSRLECWTVVSALSSLTQTIRLGTLVLCNSFRNPALLAKMIASLDVMSRGRIELGIGAGWDKNEHLSYGYSFPKLSARIDQLDESLEIIKHLWTDVHSTFQGKYYSVQNAVCDPKPLQSPHPPITIGGRSEGLYAVLSSHADRWNFNGSVAQCTNLLQHFKAYCIQQHQSYDSIEKSYYSFFTDVFTNELELQETMKTIYHTPTPYRKPNVPFKTWLKLVQQQSIIGTAEQCVSKMQQLIALGVTHFVIKFVNIKKRGQSPRIFMQEVITRARETSIAS